MNNFNSPLILRLVDLAIEEDLVFGDSTSALLEKGIQKTANIIAREDLIVCGLPLTEIIISQAKYSITVETKVAEGVKVSSGAVLQVLNGSSSELTSIERTILNFLQRLSGVATYTRAVVEQSGGIAVLDTRKTMPGYRLLDKYATSVGGAKNHRMNLAELILVKNNHIDAAEGNSIAERVDTVLNKVKKKDSFYVPFQVEVRSEEELIAVVKHFPHSILLDNMSDELIAACLGIIRAQSPKTICEVSGGVQPERLKNLAKIGVDAASMGALTTRARNVDISMKIFQ